MIKYDCFYTALKITPLLASKVAVFYGTSLLIQHRLILSVFIGFIHVESEGYSKMMI